MSRWGQRVTFEVSSANPDETPVWVDLTSRVLHAGGFELNTGRQDNLDQSQPSSLRFMLRNDDDRFTFGNTSSPYASWWGPGRKCRLRESYSSTVFDLFTGYLQVPDESVPDAKTAGQTVTVTAVDRLGRLAAAPSFLSTLAEYIRYTGGTSLLYYLPCNEVQGPYLNDPRQSFRVTESSTFVSGVDVSQTDPLLTYAAGDRLPGDELDPVVYTPALSAASALGRFAFHQNSLSTITVDSGKTIALVMWVRFTSTPSTAYNSIIARVEGPAGAYMELGAGTNGLWRATVEDFSGLVGPTTGRGIGTDVWRLVALRLTESSGLVEFWDHGGEPVTNTIGGATSAQFTSITLYGQSPAAIAHVQLYQGDSATTYTRAMHLAQIREGFGGLQRQTTGDRIRTIAAYAGIPTAEYNDTVDKGTAVMQAASLADKTPLEAMREAERTEQGLLYVDGTGRLVFKDRKSLYNV